MRTNPQIKDTLAAVRTTDSARCDSPPDCALADEYRFVVATFKKANKYVAPSINVVAGPRAANASADCAAVPESPTKDVSTRDKSGPMTQSPRQGQANLR